MRWKSSTLDDLEGQYCNKNCIGCSASSLATAGLFVHVAFYSRAPHRLIRCTTKYQFFCRKTAEYDLNFTSCSRSDTKTTRGEGTRRCRFTAVRQWRRSLQNWRH